MSCQASPSGLKKLRPTCSNPLRSSQALCPDSFKGTTGSRAIPQISDGRWDDARREAVPDPHSNLTAPLLRLWENFISIITFVSFNLALTVLADFRLCVLALITRNLILFANGIIEALFQLFLSGLETF